MFIDKRESKSQVQDQSQIGKGKMNLDSGLSLKSYDSEWPPLPAQHIKTGGQQEGEHVWVEHVQGEHCQRMFYVLRVLVIVSGPVGNPESSLVHIKEVQIPNSWAWPCQFESGLY